MTVYVRLKTCRHTSTRPSDLVANRSCLQWKSPLARLPGSLILRGTRLGSGNRSSFLRSYRFSALPSFARLRIGKCPIAALCQRQIDCSRLRNFFQNLEVFTHNLGISAHDRPAECASGPQHRHSSPTFASQSAAFSGVRLQEKIRLFVLLVRPLPGWRSAVGSRTSPRRDMRLCLVFALRMHSRLRLGRSAEPAVPRTHRLQWQTAHLAAEGSNEQQTSSRDAPRQRLPRYFERPSVRRSSKLHWNGKQLCPSIAFP